MLKDDLEALVSHLENMVQSKTVVGDPIESNGKTIIPLISVRTGFGAGTAEGSEAQHGTGKGGGGANIAQGGIPGNVVEDSLKNVVQFIDN